MVGKVTTLEHELRDHTVESRACIAKTVDSGTELSEVFGSPGDVLLKEIEVDTASLA